MRRPVAAGTARHGPWLTCLLRAEVSTSNGEPVWTRSAAGDSPWGAAAEPTLRPGALGGFLARIRKVKSDAPWWIRARRTAHDADVESVPGRGRIVVTRLLARYAPVLVSAPAPRRMYPVIGAGIRPRPRVFAYRAAVVLAPLLLLRLLAASLVPAGLGVSTLLPLLGLPAGEA